MGGRNVRAERRNCDMMVCFYGEVATKANNKAVFETCSGVCWRKQEIRDLGITVSGFRGVTFMGGRLVTLQ